MNDKPAPASSTRTVPLIELDEAEIDAVVARFYARIRAHPVLGPVFNGAVGTDPAPWREHEKRIGRFWRNALLRQPVYHGNPMLVHSGNRAVAPEHFALWLGLFDEVLAEVLPPERAAAWSRVAHRIGRALRLGVQTARARAGDVPNLRI